MLIRVLQLLVITSIAAAQQSKTTVSGATCTFPQIYNGMYMEDCFEVSGKQSCLVNGSPEECVASTGGVSRSTVDGQTCTFPFTYRGIDYQDCINVSGMEFCMITGQLVECIATGNSADDASLTPTPSPSPVGINVPEAASSGAMSPSPSTDRVTTSGQTCEFPFSFGTTSFQDCITVEGTEFCMVGGAMLECQPRSVLSTLTSTPTITATPTPAPSTTQSARKTVTGQDCDKTYTFRGKGYSGCILIEGLEFCEVGGFLLQCEPSDEVMASPAVSASPSTSPASPSVRVTVNGDSCDIPFIYRGNVLQDCMMLAGKEQCQVGGDWQDCAPSDGSTSAPSPVAPDTPVGSLVRTTKDGKTCQLPFTYYGETYSDCTIIAGQEQCWFAPENSWSICEPLQNVAPSTGIVRNTQIGICNFPNYYRGNVYNDCWSQAGIMVCEVNGILAECLDMDSSSTSSPPAVSASPSTNTASPRVTVNGDSCDIPFIYRGNVLQDCMMLAGKEQCQVGGDWQDCAPSDGSTSAASPVAPDTPVGGLVRTTKDGKTCQLPFTYYGEIYSDCTIIAGQEQCWFAPENSWSICEPLQNVAPSSGIVRNTKIGICNFPNFYRGNVYNDCWSQAGIMVCEVNGILAECLDMDSSSVAVAPVESSSPSTTSTPATSAPSTIQRMTVSGEVCTFPFNYRGGLFYDCTNISGNYSCQINGVWKECLEFVAEDIENSELKAANVEPNNQQEGGSSGSGLAAGAVAGIVIAVLFVVVLATLGVLYYLHLQRKPVSQFVKFDDPVVDGGEEVVVANGRDENLEINDVKPKDNTPEPRAFV